ncbi:hypothetical protein VCHC55B2_1641A, partial [Vibrio cholerae HC-55B2]
MSVVEYLKIAVF